MGRDDDMDKSFTPYFSVHYEGFKGVYNLINEAAADTVCNESLIRSLLPMQDFWLDIMLATREDCIVELCQHELTKISNQLKELGYYE
jgi:hypothetical protein